jgi:hypothetical protein
MWKRITNFKNWDETTDERVCRPYYIHGGYIEDISDVEGTDELDKKHDCFYGTIFSRHEIQMRERHPSFLEPIRAFQATTNADEKQQILDDNDFFRVCYDAHTLIWEVNNFFDQFNDNMNDIVDASYSPELEQDPLGDMTRVPGGRHQGAKVPRNKESDPDRYHRRMQWVRDHMTPDRMFAPTTGVVDSFGVFAPSTSYKIGRGLGAPVISGLYATPQDPHFRIATQDKIPITELTICTPMLAQDEMEEMKDDEDNSWLSNERSVLVRRLVKVYNNCMSSMQCVEHAFPRGVPSSQLEEIDTTKMTRHFDPAFENLFFQYKETIESVPDPAALENATETLYSNFNLHLEGDSSETQEGIGLPDIISEILPVDTRMTKVLQPWEQNEMARYYEQKNVAPKVRIRTNAFGYIWTDKDGGAQRTKVLEEMPEFDECVYEASPVIFYIFERLYNLLDDIEMVWLPIYRPDNPDFKIEGESAEEIYKPGGPGYIKAERRFTGNQDKLDEEIHRPGGRGAVLAKRRFTGDINADWGEEEPRYKKR